MDAKAVNTSNSFGDSQNNRNRSVDNANSSNCSASEEILSEKNAALNDLRSINEVPVPFREVFSNYPYFNKIQSKVFPTAFGTDESFVISSPTGSGKTVLFELAIVRLLLQMKSYSGMAPFKIIYVAPMKALCEERLNDWHKKFSKFGLTCASVTGDSEFTSFQNISQENLIITTPEKWDSLTRRWKDNRMFIKMVKLFMIDEVHLLNDETRGPTLEAIIIRMKTVQMALEDEGTILPIRFVALSATIPNIEDIAEWIGSSESPANYLKYGEETRPVHLTKFVFGYSYNSSISTPFKFDLNLNYKLQSILLLYAKGKPTLIFCSTRKSVEMTSKFITQNITINLKPEQKQVLLNAAATITDALVNQTLIHGVGYHHAGLIPEHRNTIENLFRNGQLPILVTTSTLAMGVNLPAHLVIIKSTKYYASGEYRDYPASTLLQMIGRAGRPQFDTAATAVIMTTAHDKVKYEKMLSGDQPVESSLHKHLTEHINAEICLQTITHLEVALGWVTSTFLRIRARKNPRHYGIAAGLTPEQIDRKLLDMCQIEINKLASSKLVTVDVENNISICATQSGFLMAKYYINFHTMKLFLNISGHEVLRQLLAIVSKCQEFSEMYLRVNDKKTLNLLNKCRNRETIRFPLTGKIKTLDMKINCIIQAVFGCLPLVEPSLLNEAQKIMRIGERILKCLIEYLENKEKCYAALLSALILGKCFHTRMWENSPFVCKQLPGIGNILTSHLVAAEKTTFLDILDMNPRDIERILRKKPPFGSELQDKIRFLPKYSLELEVVATTDEVYKSVKVTVKLLNASEIAPKLTCNKKSNMTLIVGDTSNNVLIYEKYPHSHLIKNQEITVTAELQDLKTKKVSGHFISEDWVGFDATDTFVLVKDANSEKVTSANKSTSSNQALISKYLNNNAEEKAAQSKENIDPNNNDIREIRKIQENNQTVEETSTSKPKMKRVVKKVPKKAVTFHLSAKKNKSVLNQQVTLDKFYTRTKPIMKKKRKLYNPGCTPCAPTQSSQLVQKQPDSSTKENESSAMPVIDLDGIEETEVEQIGTNTNKENIVHDIKFPEKKDEKFIAPSDKFNDDLLKKKNDLFNMFRKSLDPLLELASQNSSVKTDDKNVTLRRHEIISNVSSSNQPVSKNIRNLNKPYKSNLQGITMVKENSINYDDDQEHSTSKSYLSIFKHSEPKKCKRDTEIAETKENSNKPKSITWRSPLTHSPIHRYSPHIEKTKTKENIETPSSSIETNKSKEVNLKKPKHTLRNPSKLFPISDQQSSEFQCNPAEFYTSSNLADIVNFEDIFKNSEISSNEQTTNKNEITLGSVDDYVSFFKSKAKKYPTATEKNNSSSFIKDKMENKIKDGEKNLIDLKYIEEELNNTEIRNEFAKETLESSSNLEFSLDDSPSLKRKFQPQKFPHNTQDSAAHLKELSESIQKRTKDDFPKWDHFLDNQLEQEEKNMNRDSYLSHSNEFQFSNNSQRQTANFTQNNEVMRCAFTQPSNNLLNYKMDQRFVERPRPSFNNSESFRDTRQNFQDNVCNFQQTDTHNIPCHTEQPYIPVIGKYNEVNTDSRLHENPISSMNYEHSLKYDPKIIFTKHSNSLQRQIPNENVDYQRNYNHQEIMNRNFQIFNPNNMDLPMNSRYDKVVTNEQNLLPCTVTTSQNRNERIIHPQTPNMKRKFYSPYASFGSNDFEFSSVDPPQSFPQALGSFETPLDRREPFNQPLETCDTYNRQQYFNERGQNYPIMKSNPHISQPLFSNSPQMIRPPHIYKPEQFAVQPQHNYTNIPPTRFYRANSFNVNQEDCLACSNDMTPYHPQMQTQRNTYPTQNYPMNFEQLGVHPSVQFNFDQTPNMRRQNIDYQFREPYNSGDKQFLFNRYFQSVAGENVPPQPGYYQQNKF